MTEEHDNEVKDLREKNNELVMKVQYWKMTAAERENEKLDLMKEMNELRLKLSVLRSGGAAHARKLDAALQSASEDILSHLVQASSTVAHMLELIKTYMQDREELDTAQPRWSNLSNTPSSEKVNRVPPMLIGGRLIQPVVSLSRTLQSNNTRSSVRSLNQQNHNLSERTVFAMHTLQDVYIPLTRIDASLPTHSSDTQMEINNDSVDELGLEDSSERILEEPEDMSQSEEFDEMRRLEAVTEEVEPHETPQRPRQDNPLEGPSWLLDEPTNNRRSKSRMNLEPDSTTEVEENNPSGTSHPPDQRGVGDSNVCSFSPTVRRRRRVPPSPAPTPPAPAPLSPRPLRRHSNNNRILKVLVAKMCLEEDDGSGDASPPKRPNVTDAPKHKRPKEKSPKRNTLPNKIQSPIRDMSPSKRLMRFDAPSPNGSTDSRVIVLETKKQREPCNTTPNHSTRESRDTTQLANETSHSNDCTHDTQSHSRDSHRDNQSHNHDALPDNQGHSHDTQSHSRDSHRDNQSHNHDVHPDNQGYSHDTQSHSRDSHRDNQSHNHDTHPDNQGHSHDTQSHSRDSQSHGRVSHKTSKRKVRIREPEISDPWNVLREIRDSDSSGSETAGEGRTRRARKAVVYKERSIRSKLRR